MSLLVLGQRVGETPSPGVHIVHEPPSCMLADRVPLIKTRIEPADAVSEGRLYFRDHSNAAWYYARLERRGDAFEAPMLAYPARVQRVSYSFSVRSLGADVVSPEFTLSIAPSAEECREGRLADLGPPVEPKFYHASTGARAFVLEAKRKLPAPPAALRRQLRPAEQVIVAAVIGIAEAQPDWRYCLDVGGPREDQVGDPTKKVISALEAVGVRVRPVSSCSRGDDVLPGYSYLRLDAIEWSGESRAVIPFQRYEPDHVAGVGGSVTCRRADGFWVQDGEVKSSVTFN